MKKHLEHKISKIAGNIIMVITLIGAGMAPIVCGGIIEFMELFGLTLMVNLIIAEIDIAIADRKEGKKNEGTPRYIEGTVNLNW